MSLLLEALKKAELAKQAAKEQPPASDTPPFTRDRLPDISQPMEIHSEDLGLVEPEPTPAPKRADKPAFELALEEAPREAPAAPPARPAPAETRYSPPEETSYSPPGEAAERKQAQQLFEAKELDVNPRKPFYITLGILGLFAVGTVGYFWYQLQPRSLVSAPSSAKPAQPASPAAPAPPPSAADVPAAAATVTPPTATAVAEPVPAQRATAPVAAGAPARRSTAITRQGAPATAADEVAAPPRRTARREGEIAITPSRVQTDPVLETAFAEFNAGNLEKARVGYQQVLRTSPNSRDALLGMAAVEMQDKHYDAAERIYMRLLELDAQDAHAQAGLIGLRGQADPLATESRLKSMIASQPGASFLHFALGNQYAAQSRWGEAQQAYFQAYTGDPENPDFAYNLAVSLDRMHQAKPALEYYRRALALAGNRPVSFDKTQIAKRVGQLER